MNRIRKLFCTADPIGLAVMIVVGGMILTEMIVLGLGMFLLVVVAACMFCVVLITIGMILHKIIVLAQKRLCSLKI